MQAKLHKYCDSKEGETWSRDFEPNKHHVETVTLSPGDSLYFPAGMWHKVECEEDSISINLSIKAMRYCDLVSSAIRQVMFQSEMWRSEICGDTLGQLPEMVEKLVKDIESKIRYQSLIPPMFLIRGGAKPLDCKFDRYQTRVVYFDEEIDFGELDFECKTRTPCVHRASNVATLPKHEGMRGIFPDSYLYKNPLAVLICGKEIEHRIENMDATFENESIFEKIRELSKQYNNGVFVLHVNFGDENLESLQRIILVDRTKDQKYSEIVKRIMKVRSSSDEIKSTDRIFDGFFDEFGVVSRVLLYCGYLTWRNTTGGVVIDDGY